MKIISRPQKKVQKVIPLDECLAKTIHDESGNRPGVTVKEHSLIVGKVAGELLTRMLPFCRNEIFPKGSELISALHDIGKVSPTFQTKIYRSCDMEIDLKDPQLDKEIGYHWTVGMATFNKDVNSAKYIKRIIGLHHGKRPNSAASPSSEIYGGDIWQQQREKLSTEIEQSLSLPYPEISSDITAECITGLTVVSDWIGSGYIFDEGLKDESQVKSAVDSAGFISIPLKHDLEFKKVFGFEPRPVQKEFIDCISGEGIYILEAPMGIGKTEAALYAAYRLLSKEKATGIYFALPTQLTSDSIYLRVNDFIRKIIEKDEERKAVLLHSSSKMSLIEMGGEEIPGSSWFDFSKRGLLAPIGVGTVDQALMSVMNVRHSHVRLFGLIGKVVIIDEIHSYDVYTGTILKHLIGQLRKLHCTVIVLSATLTSNQRNEILGRGNEKTVDSYPLISALPNGEKEKIVAVNKNSSKKVTVKFGLSNSQALGEALLRAEKGQQVLWIENTVSEAQEVFSLINARIDGSWVECGLIHSRFTKIDRTQKENYWVQLYGKNGGEERRIRGRILVGTQVLEQSLDIDADFLVTRLCPSDMLLQRVGRLWRHDQNHKHRPGGSHCEMYIISPEYKEVIKEIAVLGKSHKVYSEYVLLRTMEVWKDIVSLNLPRDIRKILEMTYEYRQETGILKQYFDKLEKEKTKLERFALLSFSDFTNMKDDTTAATRFSDQVQVDLIIVSNISGDREHVITFPDGTKESFPEFCDVSRRAKLALLLAKNTVKVYEYHAPEYRAKSLDFLKNYIYLGNDEVHPIRMGILQKDMTLKGVGMTDPLKSTDLLYDSVIGFRAVKRGEYDEKKQF